MDCQGGVLGECFAGRPFQQLIHPDLASLQRPAQHVLQDPCNDHSVSGTYLDAVVEESGFFASDKVKPYHESLDKIILKWHENLSAGLG